MRTYLTSPTAREAVVAGVADSIVSWQPDVVIGHSLGAVVAVEALARSRAIHAPSAVLTLGAPFPWPRFVEQWSPSAREWLLEPAVPWLNVVDLSDVVTASVIPTPEVYAGAAHLVVDNDHHVDLWPGGPWWDPRDTVDLMSTHRASLYLNHPAVAEVFAALLGGSPAQAASGNRAPERRRLWVQGESGRSRRHWHVVASWRRSGSSGVRSSRTTVQPPCSAGV